MAAALARLAWLGTATASADGPTVAGLSPAELGWDPKHSKYVLPPLPYPTSALEPAIDRHTVRIHHDLHHAAYVKGLNAAIAGLEKVRDGRLPASATASLERDLAFNGSGHFLHVVYWRGMTPVTDNAPRQPPNPLLDAIDRDFGSLDALGTQFAAAANSVEGSGWAILALEPVSGRLMVVQAERHQDLDVAGVRPLLACDVWEHAYYLSYQNRRADYVKAWMGLVDWNFAASRM